MYSLFVVVISWLNTLYLGIDACFKLKLKDRGFSDPDLGTSLAYMVNNNRYRDHLGKFTADTPENVRARSSRILATCTDPWKQVTTCGSDLHAVNDAYVKNSTGYLVTGVVAVSCRHALVRRNGVADLQKGER